MALSDQELRELMERLKENINSLDGGNSLESQLESGSKHLPAYVKIVKDHISQLANVLKLESHNNRSIDNINLAKPVRQLMEIFKDLTHEDLNMVEQLYSSVRIWQNDVSHEEDNTAPAASDIETSAV